MYGSSIQYPANTLVKRVIRHRQLGETNKEHGLDMLIKICLPLIQFRPIFGKSIFFTGVKFRRTYLWKNEYQ